MISGELELELEDGTILRAQTDLFLAKAWAEHLHTTEEWASMTLGQRSREVYAALHEIRRACGTN